MHLSNRSTKTMVKMKDGCFFIMFVVISVTAENKSGINTRCQCMEYWECFRSGGNFSNYCGLNESKVCCKIPRNVHSKMRSLQSKCGQKGKDSGKIGTAEPTEWPWHVAILEKANHIYICGASLIDENWVLTAAHCVQRFIQDDGRVSGLTARLGEYDVRSSAEFHRHEEQDIAEIFLHPEYSPRTLLNDIALLRLRFPAQRRPNIDFVCVPRPGMTPRLLNKRSCFVTGWGRRNTAAKHSEVLKEVQVPLWQTARCQFALKQHFGEDYILPDSLICAGDEGNDACDGDGGGPLVCEESGQWYQVGIVSFGLGCGEKDTPGVYTKLNEYETWIKNIMNLQLKLKTGILV